MRFSVVREDMHKLLQHVTRVIERQQTREILLHALVEVSEEGVLNIGCTDLEMSITATKQLTAEGSGLESGSIAIEGLTLFEIFDKLPAGTEVELHSDGDAVFLNSPHRSFKLSTMSTELMPGTSPSAEIESFQVSADALSEMFRKTSIGMARNDVRTYLNGMCMEVSPEHLRTIATDGIRLVLFTHDGGRPGGDLTQIILPRKTVGELIFLLSHLESDASVDLTLGGNFVTVQGEEFKLTSNLIEGRYPQYNLAVPNDNENPIRCDRTALRQAIASTVILSSQSDRLVVVSTGENTLKLEASNEKGHRADVELAVDACPAGLRQAFNGQSMVDLLDTMTDDHVTFHMPPPDGPPANAKFVGEEDDKFICVLSPMRM